MGKVVGLSKRKALTILAFLLICFCGFQFLTFTLRNKSIENMSMLPNSYKNKCDVLFVGSSVIMNDVYPMQLYNDYGIASYNLGSGEQSIPSSYYLIKQMIREGNIKLVVLDVFYIYQENKYSNEGHLHYVTDKMDYPEKIECVFDLVSPEKRIDFLYELGLYHERWEYLEGNDFQDWTERDRRTAYGAKVHYVSVPMEDVGEIKDTVTQIPENNEEYLRKIIQLCQDNNVDIMLTLMPATYTGVWNGYDRDVAQGYWNAVQVLADEYGINYLNFMYHHQEIGFDWEKDSDGETHLNAWGSEKLTKYMGNYLKENYNLPDVRTNPDYDFMKSDYVFFEEYKQRLCEEAKN